MSITEREGPTIEEKGEEQAYKQTSMMRSNTGRIVAVANLTQRDLLDLPRLGSGKGQPFQDNVRYDTETGDIFTPIWKDMKTFIDPETNKRSIKSPEKHTHLTRSRNVNIQDPEDLPKNKKISVKVLTPTRASKGLESAIRQQYHILDMHSPARTDAEPQKLRKVIHWIDQAAQELIEGPVSKERLEQMSQQAAELISNLGLPNAVDQTKKKLAVMLERASKLDIRGRVNPMISRIRLRAALIAATRRIVTGELVNRKFSANLGVLVAEREFTRYDLELAYSALDSVMGIARRLEFDPSSVSKSERDLLSSQLREIALRYLRFPRVAPYLLPSRMAVNFLIGIRDEKKESNTKALGQETAEEIYTFSPAVALLKNENEEDQKEAGREIRWARNIVREALDLPEHNNLTPSPRKTKAKKPVQSTNSHESVTQTVFDLTSTS